MKQIINDLWATKIQASLIYLLCIIPVASHASLVSMDSNRWGAGSLTKDSVTGLQWLDLNLATNISYNSMLTEQGGGGVYAGFRYATANEVEALFINAGTPDVNSDSAANVAAAQGLIALMGASYSFRGNDEIFGITGTATTTGTLSAIVDHTFNNGAVFYDVNTVSGPVYGLDYRNASIGNWLVQTTQVPIPPAFMLFSSALACLGILKKKLKK